MDAFTYQFNGFTFGATTDIQVAEITGLRAMPSIRSGDVAKPRQNGAQGGLDYYDERIVTYTLAVFAPQNAPFDDTLAQIGSAFALINDPANVLPLSVMLSGAWPEPKILYCRPSKGATPIDPTYGQQYAKIVLELTAPDPLVYSTTVHSASSKSRYAGAGMAFPTAFPVVFGAAQGSVFGGTNAGNETTAPVITIKGPCTNPSISLVGGGTMSVNLTLAAGDDLVIDMGLRSITLNGANRFNVINVGSSWWGLPPGDWQASFATADSAATSASAIVEWQDAWGWF